MVTERTVLSRAPRDHVVVVTRRLSLNEHGALELLVGLALIAAPFALGFGPAGLVASTAAGAVIAGLGLSEGMPISSHMTADTAVAVALLGVAVLVSAQDAVAGGVLAAAAAGELALGACTRWTRRA